MKGRAVTVEQRRFHDLLVRHIGCVACRHHGVENHYCSIHHIDGRTKPDAHWLVFGLCGPHHQDDGSGAIAIHPYKAQFEATYGRQRAIHSECVQALVDAGVPVPERALVLAGIQVQEAAY